MNSKVDKILVVKVGTSTLIAKRNSKEYLDYISFKRIGLQIQELCDRGFKVIIVSSAAITAGMLRTGLSSRPKETVELQRLASIGWQDIVSEWSKALGKRTIGTLLLTRHELDLPHEREEALRVTYSLLSNGNVVVANENDAITHEEIAFGDNDVLAAMYAAKIRRSDLFENEVRLILLSDVDGVYSRNGDPATLIKQINNIESYRHLISDSKSTHGTGGMASKFLAAEIAINNGVSVWIANGRKENVLEQAINNKTGTSFT